MREDPFAISTKTVSFQQIVLDVLARSRVVESSSSLESMPQDLIHLSLSQKKLETVRPYYTFLLYQNRQISLSF